MPFKSFRNRYADELESAAIAARAIQNRARTALSRQSSVWDGS